MMKFVRKCGLFFMMFLLVLSGTGPLAQAKSSSDDRMPKNRSGAKEKKQEKANARQTDNGKKTSLEKKKREWASGSR